MPRPKLFRSSKVSRIKREGPHWAVEDSFNFLLRGSGTVFACGTRVLAVCTSPVNNNKMGSQQQDAACVFQKVMICKLTFGGMDCLVKSWEIIPKNECCCAKVLNLTDSDRVCLSEGPA